MSSILTNTAAMSALSSLTATQSQLSTTQAQISSGLAVANASDNEAYWSIGKTMSAQVSGLSAMQQSLGLTQSIASVAATAISAILSGMQKIKADVVSAQTAGVDKSKVQEDISGQVKSILSVASSASFNGVNWLDFDNSIVSPTSAQTNQFATGDTYGGTDGNHITSSPYFNRANASFSPYAQLASSAYEGVPTKLVQVPLSVGSSGVTFTSVDISGIQMISSASSNGWWVPGQDTTQGILNSRMYLSGQSIEHLDITNLNNTQLDDLDDDLGFATKLITGAADTVATLQTQVSNMQTFNSALTDSLNSGIGSLVDADMNVASTRLQALQTQQQLGIQALSMANQNSQLILKLFQAA